MECRSCRAALPEAARFCLQCGALASPSAEPLDGLRATLATALGRQYQVARLLGRGGMGAVYLATEAALEREVAIKVLPPDRSATPESRERFRREARTAARLSHPNIVPLHTFGDVDGTLYFVMGYVRGESLAARIRRQGRIDLEETRRIVAEIADALDYAHALGIVHRDIKPDNVLLEAGSGRAMLTDFGVAKALGSGQTVASEGSIIGTPHYMSPEQAQGKADIDGRSDLYSLGVMAYTMLAGRLPFDGTTPGDVLVQHITKEPPALATLAPGVPPEMSAAITRCLAKAPAARHASAKALRQALAIDPVDGPLPEPFVSLWQATQVVFVAGIAALLLFLNKATAPPPFDPLDSNFVQDGLPALFLVVVAGALVSALAAGFELKRKGHPTGRILRAALTKPDWWFGPFPKALRAPHDVWSRLPPLVRRVRGLMTAAALMYVLVLIPFMLVIINASHHYRRTGKQEQPLHLSPLAEKYLAWALGAAELGLLGSAGYFFMRWKSSSLGRLSLMEEGRVVDRVFFWDTGRASHWARPEIAALLSAPDQAPDHKQPASPQELLQAIERALESMPTGPRAACAAVLPAARGLVAAIQTLDGELTAVAGTVDPAEPPRLAERLAALGPDAPEDGEDRRRMREMFRQQLDFMRGLEQRVAEAKARRVQRLDWLQALWRAAAAGDAAAGARILAQLRDWEPQIGGSGNRGGVAAASFSELPTLEK